MRCWAAERWVGKAACSHKSKRPRVWPPLPAFSFLPALFLTESFLASSLSHGKGSSWEPAAPSAAHHIQPSASSTKRNTPRTLSVHITVLQLQSWVLDLQELLMHLNHLIRNARLPEVQSHANGQSLDQEGNSRLLEVSEVSKARPKKGVPKGRQGSAQGLQKVLEPCCREPRDNGQSPPPECPSISSTCARKGEAPHHCAGVPSSSYSTPTMTMPLHHVPANTYTMPHGEPKGEPWGANPFFSKNAASRLAWSSSASGTPSLWMTRA